MQQDTVARQLRVTEREDILQAAFQAALQAQGVRSFDVLLLICYMCGYVSGSVCLMRAIPICERIETHCPAALQAALQAEGVCAFVYSLDVLAFVCAGMLVRVCAYACISILFDCILQAAF